MRVGILVSLLAGLLLLACGEETKSRGQGEKSLTLLYQSAPDSLDPGAARSQRARFILTRLIGSGLMERGLDGALEPVLAAGPIETLDDGFRVHLREAARWSDGRRVEASDFQRSHDLVTSGKVGGLLAAGWARITGVEVESPSTFKLLAAETGIAVREQIAFELIPVPPSWQPGTALEIGPGPFALVTNERNQTVLARRADWWGDALPELSGRFRLDRLILRYESDQTRTLALLQSGAVDVAAIDPERVSALDARVFRFESQDSGGFSFVGFDCREGVTADRNLRRILADSAPRELADRRAHELQASVKLVDDEGVVEAQSLATLARALDEAGYRDRDGDGRREGMAGPLRLRLLAATGTISWLDSLLIHWQGKLADLGIELEVERLELKALLARLESRDFDLFVLVWRRDAERDSFRALLHSSQIEKGGRNFCGFASPAIDQAIAAVEGADTEEACAQARRALAALAAEEAPLAPLFRHLITVALRRDRVRLPFSPAGPCWSRLERL